MNQENRRIQFAIKFNMSQFPTLHFGRKEEDPFKYFRLTFVP